MRFPAFLTKSSVFLALLTAWLFTTQQSAAQTPEITGQLANNVTIVRDSFGVPHVYANTDTAALYGLGYAQARDRLFQMYYSRAAYQGRLAEFFGKGAEVSTGSNTYSNIQHDITARILGWSRHAATVAQRLDAPTLQLMHAFCDGVNDYAASPGAEISPLFASTGIPLTDWTPTDCIGAWYRFGRFFSPLGLNEGAQRARVDAMKAMGWTEFQIANYLNVSPVCDDTAVVVEQSDVPPSLQAEMSSYAQALGVRDDLACRPGADVSFSQAMVATGSKVSTGEALLLAEPRLPIFVPNMLYEASVQAATFRVRGACLPGTANFLVGSTRSQAWGVTALGLDQSDLFRLVTDSVGHPGRYRIEGAWRAFTQVGLESVTVKGEPGLNTTIAVLDSYFGPVVTAIVGDCVPEPAIGVGPGCTSGHEYACRAIPFALDDQDAFQGYMSMYRATDLTAFLQATEKLIWPSMNMLVASSGGSIGYIAAGACPVRKADEFLAGLIALDGDTASNDWQAYLPNHLKPWVIDPSAEFLVSANHRPIGSWYPFSSLYPNIGDSLRSWRLREVLESTTSFTPATFRGLHQDRVLPSAREITLIGAYLRDRTTFQLSSLALTALRSLVPWVNAGAQMDAEHGGVALAHFLRRSSRRDWASPALLAKYGAGEAGLSLFLRTVKAKISASPPLSLTSEESGAIDFLLADAQRKLPAAAAASLRAMADWYTQNFLVGSTAPGTGAPFVYGQQLEGAGAWDPNLTFAFGPLLATDPSTNCSQKGDSYSQFVRPSLTDGAESILPLGISEHPSAPEFTNQKAAWEAARLKPSPTTLPGVQALGPTQTTVLSHP